MAPARNRLGERSARLLRWSHINTQPGVGRRTAVSHMHRLRGQDPSSAEDSSAETPLTAANSSMCVQAGAENWHCMFTTSHMRPRRALVESAAVTISHP